MNPKDLVRVYNMIESRVTIFMVGGYRYSYMNGRKQWVERNGRKIGTFCADLLVFAVDPHINN